MTIEKSKLVLFWIIVVHLLSSCNLRKNDLLKEEMSSFEYEKSLKDFSTKYSFPSNHIDTLKKAQPSLFKEDALAVDSIINLSLIKFMVTEYNMKHLELEYTEFYIHPESTVAWYNYTIGSPKVEPIENGIIIIR